MTNGIQKTPSPVETTTFGGLDFDHDHANNDSLIVRVEHDPDASRPFYDLNVYASHDGTAPVFCNTVSGTGPAGWNAMFGPSSYDNGTITYQFLDAAGTPTQSYQYDATWIADYFDDQAVHELMQKYPDAVEWRALYHSNRWDAAPDIAGKTIATRFTVSVARDAEGNPDQTRLIFREVKPFRSNHRQSDDFEIPVTAEQYESFAALGLHPDTSLYAAAVLTQLAVRTESRDSEGDGSNGVDFSPPPIPSGGSYRAQLVDWLAIDQTNPESGDWKYLRGETASLTGRVVGFQDGGALTLLTDEGKRYDVILNSAAFAIHTRWDENKPAGPANLEAQAARVAPLLGDRVSLSAEVGRDPAREGAYIFTAEDSYNAALIEAGETRLASYRATRADIADRQTALTKALGQGEYAAARKIFGALVDSLLTREERGRVLATLPSFPETERPCDYFVKLTSELSSWQLDMKALNANYGVTLQGMTRDEALAFFTGIISDDIYPQFMHELHLSKTESVVFWGKVLDADVEERRTFLQIQKTLMDYAKARSGGEIPDEYENVQQEKWVDRAIADGVFSPQQRPQLLEGYSQDSQFLFETVIANLATSVSGEAGLEMILKTFETVVLKEPNLEDFGLNRSFNAGVGETVNGLCWSLFICLGGRKISRSVTTENYDPALLKKLKAYAPTLTRIRDEMARRPETSKDVEFLDGLLKKFASLMQELDKGYDADLELGKQVLLVTSKDNFQAIWERIHGKGSPLPDVDFNANVVVVAVMGIQYSGGYGIQIENFLAGENTLNVTVQTTRPGQDCFVTSSLTNPYHIVTIPNLGLSDPRTAKIEVEEVSREEDCH